MKLEIYTDGACKGNPGPGGWGVLLRYGTKEKTLKGGEVLTTNNRMELMAAIQALAALKRTCEVNLYTDSQYVKQGMTVWMPEWKRKNWRNSKNEAVKNADLWQQLDNLARQHNVHWHWVKGHSNHPENDRADALANQAISELADLINKE
jgi:ribonuclease HI